MTSQANRSVRPHVDAAVGIIGAGPAGSAAAITLRRAGLTCLLIDRAEFPRDKCCGDGLTTGALRLLDDLGLEPASVASWCPVDEIDLWDPSGRARRFPLPTGGGQFAAVARRAELDASLVERAANDGAETLLGRECTAVEPGADLVRISLADGSTLHVRHVIAADGMWSPTRTALGLTPEGYRGEWHAFRQYVTNVGPAARERLHVWFEPDLVPGYVWSFPLPDGGANIGFGIQRDGRHKVSAMGQLWRDILERPHIRAVLGPDAVPEAPHRAWPIPARVGSLPLTWQRTFFVGDAAGATDVLTGEGIGQALATGIMAGEAIAANDAAPGAARTDYERRVQQAFSADHRMSTLLSDTLGRQALGRPIGTSAALAIAGATPWTRRNFARWLFEDYPRAALLTPRRWNRSMFSKPGAFEAATPEAI